MQIVERDVTTVLLDRRNANELRPFYCNKCGKCVCEIYGDVRALIPGVPEAVDIHDLNVQTAVNCNGYFRDRSGNNVKCNAKYIF